MHDVGINQSREHRKVASMSCTVRCVELVLELHDALYSHRLLLLGGFAGMLPNDSTCFFDT